MSEMTERAQLIALVENRVTELCERHHIRRPRIAYDLKGRCAGKAHLQRFLLRFNLTLLAENTEAFLGETVPHELCHIWKAQLGLPGRSHGPEWQRLMRRMEAEPRRLHDYDTSRAGVRKVKRYIYVCACPREYGLLGRQVNRIKRGTQYRCRKCQVVLRPKGESESYA